MNETERAIDRIARHPLFATSFAALVAAGKVKYTTSSATSSDAQGAFQFLPSQPEGKAKGKGNGKGKS